MNLENIPEISDEILKKMNIQSIAFISEHTFNPRLIIKYTDGRENLSIDEQSEVDNFFQKLKEDDTYKRDK